MADVCLHSEFEIAPKQLTGRFRKFGTIADTCLSYLYNLFIYVINAIKEDSCMHTARFNIPSAGKFKTVIAV